MTMDDDGVRAESAGSVVGESEPGTEYFDAPDWEIEVRALEERASRQALLQTELAEMAQDDEIAAQALAKREIMLRISDVAQDF